MNHVPLNASTELVASKGSRQVRSNCSIPLGLHHLIRHNAGDIHSKQQTKLMLRDSLCYHITKIVRDPNMCNKKHNRHGSNDDTWM